MKILNLNYRLCLILIIGAFLALFLPFWWSQIGRLVSLNSQLADNRQRLTSLASKRATLEALDESDLKNKNDFLFQVLPITGDPLVLISGLRLLTEKSGVTVDEIDIASASEIMSATASGQPIALKVVVAGDLPHLLEFTSLAPEMYPLVQLKFEKITGGEAGGYRASLEATTFFQSVPTSVGSVETPVVVSSAEEKELFNRLATLKPLFSDHAEQNNFIAVPSGKDNPFVF